MSNQYCNALTILGPTTTGKTSVAFEVARRLGGEMINGDKFYTFRGFSISTGLFDSLQSPDISTHLYQILEPTSERLTVPSYKGMVDLLVPQLLEMGKLPVIEGCSYGYINALIEGNEQLNHFQYHPLVGLRWAKPCNVHEEIERRVDEMFKGGLLDEVQGALSKGYGDTYVMRKSVICVPIVELLKGEIDERTAKDKILVGILDIAYNELRKFLDVPEIHWIEHDSTKMEDTLTQIEELTRESNHL
jgi:tRNA A37 N6-isopentenylltransferase MiaA